MPVLAPDYAVKLTSTIGGACLNDYLIFFFKSTVIKMENYICCEKLESGGRRAHFHPMEQRLGLRNGPFSPADFSPESFSSSLRP